MDKNVIPLHRRTQIFFVDIQLNRVQFPITWSLAQFISFQGKI